MFHKLCSIIIRPWSVVLGIYHNSSDVIPVTGKLWLHCSWKIVILNDIPQSPCTYQINSLTVHYLIKEPFKVIKQSLKLPSVGWKAKLEEHPFTPPRLFFICTWAWTLNFSGNPDFNAQLQCVNWTWVSVYWSTLYTVPKTYGCRMLHHPRGKSDVPSVCQLPSCSTGVTINFPWTKLMDNSR